MKKFPWIIRTGIGQDSHVFSEKENENKPCILAGVTFSKTPGFIANSDGDIVYHAICNAISSLTHTIILGKIADELLEKEGINNSEVYLKRAVSTLEKQVITHVALTLEGKRPKFLPNLLQMRENISKVLNISVNQVGITATTGETLTNFGLGKGVQCFCIITTMEEIN